MAEPTDQPQGQEPARDKHKPVSVQASKDEGKASRKPRSFRRKGKKKEQHGKEGVRLKVSAEQLPRRSLEQALRVAKALRDTLAGGPANLGRHFQCYEHRCLCTE
jgi:hypothetical protein